MRGRQEPLLTIRGLHKAFGSHQVLKGVDLELEAGEVLGLVGPNGVGKSTMASIIAGNTPADSGEIRLSGPGWDAKRIMLIDPEHRLDPDLTIAQAMFRASEGEHSDEELLIKARRTLAEAGIPLLPTDRLGALSPTDLRMTEVARILGDPRDVILVDELSNALSRLELEDLRYALMRSTKQNRGVIYVTHHLDEAIRLCDRIAVLRDGRVEGVFESRKTTVDELTEAMFGETVNSRGRHSHATQDVVLDVEGLNCTGTPISFRLHRGEVLGFNGARHSGISELRDALLGKHPGEFESLMVDGLPASIASPRDLPALGVSVLTNMSDPDSDSHTARNIAMLDGEDIDDEGIEDTTKILLMLRESESRLSKLMKRPMLSTGQRRWQQMQELASQTSRIMILIEPSEGLDVAMQDRFMRLLEEVTGRGVGILLFTSNEAELQQLSDRVLEIADGAIQSEWSPLDMEPLHVAS